MPLRHVLLHVLLHVLFIAAFLLSPSAFATQPLVWIPTAFPDSAFEVRQLGPEAPTTINTQPDSDALRKFNTWVQGASQGTTLNDLLFEAASLGLGDAQYFLAWEFITGTNRDIDLPTAAKWFALAAKSGHAGAQLQLGRLYVNGAGVEKNVERAARWLSRAGTVGSARTKRWVAEGFWTGRWVDQDRPTAIAWYQAAADLEDVDAVRMLITIYSDGLGVERDAIKAFRLRETLALKGDKAMQIEVGRAYAQGTPIPRNDQKAFEWFKRAESAEMPEAYYQLGLLYANGRGIEKDEIEAIRMFGRAASRGWGQAEVELNARFLTNPDRWEPLDGASTDGLTKYGLYILYSQGVGVTSSVDTSQQWLAKSATKSFVSAQLALAKIYLARQKRALAIYWYRKASANGSKEAPQIIKLLTNRQRIVALPSL